MEGLLSSRAFRLIEEREAMVTSISRMVDFVVMADRIDQVYTPVNQGRNIPELKLIVPADTHTCLLGIGISVFRAIQVSLSQFADRIIIKDIYTKTGSIPISKAINSTKVKCGHKEPAVIIDISILDTGGSCNVQAPFVRKAWKLPYPRPD